MIELEGIEEVQEWSSSVLLEVGWHDVTIEECEQGTSSGNHPQLELRFASKAGDIREWMVMIPSSMGKVKSFLLAAEVPIRNGGFDETQLVGKKLSIYVGEEESFKEPGTMRRVVKAFAPLSDHKGDPRPDQSDFGVQNAQKVPEDDIPF